MDCPTWFSDALATHKRIAICGGPHVGKTTLAGFVNDRPVVHGDDYKHLEWSMASQVLADDVNAIEGPVVVEGVAVVRALRKGLKVDCVVMLFNPPFGLLIKGQAAMTKAVATVYDDWRNNAAQPLPVIISIYELCQP